MKKLGFTLAVVFFLSLGWSAVYGSQKGSETNAISREVNKEVRVAADAKDTSMKTEYEKYRKKIQVEINEYKAKMKQLEAKAKNLEDKAREDAKEGMRELQGKVNAAEQKLKSMKSASGEAWEKMKSEVDSAMTSLKETYEKVAAHFK